ncbi:transcription antiterminator [Clostridium sp. D2Q-14]|uniref:BglG family transcription antiterminator n=1 Tax=Anaeromonas gelatinilytica TaxID=2683194 RepID=UPI00193B84C9|nr:BglG family transcription antiterminator [Anaeromonas gelatinilytica]MBS4536776.1 transcription antiterminator [Anaeromonas gelatinilytica]
MANIFNGRLILILNKLLNSYEFLTSSYLAEMIGVSSRTIRSDLKELKKLLFPYGADIVSVKGKGNKLRIVNEKKFNELLKDISYQLKYENNIPHSPYERVNYIIRRLLLEKNPLTLENLSDEMYISLSTIKNDLKNVKSILKDFKLNIVAKGNIGITIEGEEIYKRFCISQYILNREVVKEDIDNEIEDINIFNDIDFILIKRVLTEELIKQKFYLADIALNNLMIHIAIAMERIVEEKYIPLENAKINILKKEKEYNISKNIVEKLERAFQIKIPDSEICYITMHLLGSKLLEKKEEQDLLYLINDDIKKLILKIIEEINTKLNIDFTYDKKLMYSLALHLRPTLHRVKFDMNVRNPLLDEIKSKYSLAFQMGIIAASIIEDEIKYKIDENEIGYIAMHFGGAIERKKKLNQKTKKIAIICSSGMGTSNLLLAKLKNSLNIDADFIGTFPLHKIKNVIKLKPDVILTTIPIKEKTNIPTILVSTILDDSDLIHIRNKIKNINKNFEDFFEKDLFFKDIDYSHKLDVIEFLTQKMIEKNYINKKVKKSIIERESVSSTAIGNLIAIPHPLEAVEVKSSICIGILKESIEWEKDRKVQLVLVLILAKENANIFEELFNTLYQVTKSPSSVSKLIKSNDFEKFHSNFIIGKETMNKWN